MLCYSLYVYQSSITSLKHQQSSSRLRDQASVLLSWVRLLRSHRELAKREEYWWIWQWLFVCFISNFLFHLRISFHIESWINRVESLNLSIHVFSSLIVDCAQMLILSVKISKLLSQTVDCNIISASFLKILRQSLFISIVQKSLFLSCFKRTRRKLDIFCSERIWWLTESCSCFLQQCWRDDQRTSKKGTDDKRKNELRSTYERVWCQVEECNLTFIYWKQKSQRQWKWDLVRNE